MAEALPAKAQEAVDKVLACVEIEFTGTLVFEFNQGVPQLCKTTNTHRFGKARDRKRLDGDRTAR